VRWPATRAGHTRVIESGPTSNARDAQASAGQTQLPARVRGRFRWLGTRITGRTRDAARTLRDRPRHAALVAGAVLLRWVLRIALPIAGAGIMLHMFPYRAAAGGVHFHVEGTLLTRSGLSADTTFGSWEFKHVTLLPIGVHIRPDNVDVVRLASAATQNGQAYVDELRADFEQQLPTIVLWLVGETLIGIVLGLAVAAAINLAVRHLLDRPRRENELRLRVRQLAGALLVTALVAMVGAVTYNSRWIKESRVTGTLAALQLFPGQLQQYYNEHSKAVDVLNAIAGIQSGLQQGIDESENASGAYNIMYISDMHLAATYPLIKQYAENFDVKLIINTGDESEFGTTAEMTPTYLEQIESLTKTVPMIWLAGNHDSPATVEVMRSIPGVTVLGTKTFAGDGGFAVHAQQVDAYGLSVAAVPDPRVYGGSGVFGSNDADVVHALERRAVDGAVKGIPRSAYFDIFATHEPVAAQQLVSALPGQIRQTNAGHEHKQNKDSEVEPQGKPITLVEGSSGAGGLDTINTGQPRVPIEFTIESVAADCQFTKLVRFQISGRPAVSTEQVPDANQNVSATTLYLEPQDIKDGRSCTVAQGITNPRGVG
jgi:hypothetical protein